MIQVKWEEKKSVVDKIRASLPQDRYTSIARFRETFKKAGLSTSIIRQFRKVVFRFFEKHGRALPWRQTTDPYHILVSEIMLQQTQVGRVVEKYQEFVSLFPDVQSLAGASLQDVLNAWLGLGYNRRAVALKKSAEKIVADFCGFLPPTEKELLQLPGVGKYTAGAIRAFAFNQPVVLIETNVRTVFIHFFFEEHLSIKDQEILPLVEKTLYKPDPRQWYNALMDYGVMLKKTLPNPSRRSAHHSKQSPFKGSDRQIRGMVLRMLASGKARDESAIVEQLGKETGRVKRILHQLEEEGFIRKKGRTVILS